MARNFKELQEKMDPADRVDNRQRVGVEIQRMALDGLRHARQLTQADLAEMLDVPQSSVSRIEQRADMYLSTLRNYIQALGGVLQIQAIFPDAGPVAITRFGDYEDQAYVVRARRESKGAYQLNAQPVDQGVPLATRPVKPQAFTKTLKALHLTDSQISAIREAVDLLGVAEIGGRLGPRIFSPSDLVAVGFEATVTTPGTAPS
jgi:transcriptional regulator with XRE-family HTH domain